MKTLYLKKTEAVEAALVAVNGRADSHTLTTAFQLARLADRAERRLISAGVPKNMWRGVSVSYRPSGPGKAYARKSRYIITTAVTLTYAASGWALESATRAEPWADSSEVFRLMVPAEVRERIVSEALKDVVEV